MCVRYGSSTHRTPILKEEKPPLKEKYGAVAEPPDTRMTTSQRSPQSVQSECAVPLLGHRAYSLPGPPSSHCARGAHSSEFRAN